MSDAMIVASVVAVIVVAALLGRAATPSVVDELVARGVLTAAQGQLVQDGLSIEEAMSIPDECAKRCDVNIAREFPLVCDCPGDQ